MPLSGYTAIYGGSFSPPHIGHQVAAMWLIEALNAKEVIIVPTYSHAFGKELADFDHRVEMCRKMIGNLWPENDELPGKVWVSEVERDLPHPNITLNTVKEFNKTRKNIAVVIGSDLLHDLDEWKGWSEVVKLAKVVVVGRAGAGHADHDYAMFEYPVELSSISSSQIRGQIRRGKDIVGFVPSDVKKYIEENNLYKNKIGK